MCRARMPRLCETVDTRPCLLGTPQLMEHILASDELFAQQFASARGVGAVRLTEEEEEEEEEEATREDSHFGAGAQGTHQFATLDMPYVEDDEYEARLEAMRQVHAATVHDSLYDWKAGAVSEGDEDDDLPELVPIPLDTQRRERPRQVVDNRMLFGIDAMSWGNYRKRIAESQLLALERACRTTEGAAPEMLEEAFSAHTAPNEEMPGLENVGEAHGAAALDYSSEEQAARPIHSTCRVPSALAGQRLHTAMMDSLGSRFARRVEEKEEKEKDSGEMPALEEIPVDAERDIFARLARMNSDGFARLHQIFFAEAKENDDGYVHGRTGTVESDHVGRVAHRTNA